MNKFLEASFSILSIIGAILVSSCVSWGWIVWLSSNIFGTVWAKRTKNHYVLTMNLFFAVTNSIGIYNYLITPYMITG